MSDGSQRKLVKSETGKLAMMTQPKATAAQQPWHHHDAAQDA